MAEMSDKPLEVRLDNNRFMGVVNAGDHVTLKLAEAPSKYVARKFKMQDDKTISGHVKEVFWGQSEGTRLALGQEDQPREKPGWDPIFSVSNIETCVINEDSPNGKGVSIGDLVRMRDEKGDKVVVGYVFSYDAKTIMLSPESPFICESKYYEDRRGLIRFSPSFTAYKLGRLPEIIIWDQSDVKENICRPCEGEIYMGLTSTGMPVVGFVRSYDKGVVKLSTENQQVSLRDRTLLSTLVPPRVGKYSVNQYHQISKNAELTKTG